MALEDTIEIEEVSIKIGDIEGVEGYTQTTIDFSNKVKYSFESDNKHNIHIEAGKYGSICTLVLPDKCIEKVIQEKENPIVKFTNEVFFYGLFLGKSRIPPGFLFSYKLNKFESTLLSIPTRCVAKITSKDGKMFKMKQTDWDEIRSDL